MQVRQIEFGRILYCQHHWQLFHAVQRLCNMRRQHAVGIDLIVIEEAVGRLQFSW